MYDYIIKKYECTDLIGRDPGDLLPDWTKLKAQGQERV